MSKTFVKPLQWVLAVIVVFIVAISAAVSMHSIALAGFTPLTLQGITDDFFQRYDNVALSDTVAPAYKQPADGRSSVAALAYLLTRFGDTVRVSDVSVIAGGYAREVMPSSVIKMASQLGYTLKSKSIDYTQLPNGNAQPVIALMKNSLYVVVHSAGDQVVVFDPRMGRVVAVDGGVFAGQWLGEVLGLGLEAY